MIRIDMIENLIHSRSLVSVFYTNMFRCAGLSRDSASRQTKIKSFAIIS